MKERILVTGGAGFIGSHLVDALVERGYEVTIVDNLDPQVHGQARQVPEYLNKDSHFVEGDIRDEDVLWRAMKDVDVIFHFAAAVGVGQSMYRIKHYADVNVCGTANLLQLLVDRNKTIKKIIIASSMSIYGEGAYQCATCGEVYPRIRPVEQLREKTWKLACPRCSKYVKPIPTSEDKPLHPTSIYAVTKRDQEEACLSFGVAYNIPVVALRFFNVYGSRQALSNPYTGVGAIFSSRLLNNNPPLIFEDGNQSRDFIHVSDIVRANILAAEREEANYQILNVGTGRPTKVFELAEILSRTLGTIIEPELVNKFRAGDIRHCYADISKTKELLGFEPKVYLETGAEELIQWVKHQEALDRVEIARKELEEKGLTV